MGRVTEGTKYIARCHSPGFTEGKQYEEWAVHPCVFNAAVRNDEGRVVFIPRKRNFVIIGEPNG